MSDIFTNIYKNNKWKNKESVSGSGSTISATKHVVTNLNNIISKYQIKSILDIPCGDFNWMKNVNLENIQYYGADIVKDLITSNQSKYPQYNFSVMDLSKDVLPMVDLIFCRDCLFHLPYDMILSCINNIKKSNSKYLLTTTFPDKNIPNKDINIGQWRSLNLEIAPMFFPKPIEIFSEKTYKDKSMGLWEIKYL